MPAPPVLLALLLCSADPQAAAEDTAAPDPAVAAILAQWEAATADRVPVSEAEKAAMRLASNRSEELLELSVALHGPVSAADLLERYDWRLHRTPLGQRTLSAVPRDPLARAFTPRLFVVLDAASMPNFMTNPAEAPTNPTNWQEEARNGLTAVEMKNNIVHGQLVVRAQNAEPQSDATERPPIRTALFTKPAGDEPTWKIERRVKKIPATQLVNNPLPKKGPRAE